MQERKSSKKLLAVFIGIGTALLFYLLFGIVSAIIPNTFFTRMTPIGWLEHVSLLTTSGLLGTYFALSYYAKTKENKICARTATAGGIFGFLTFGCSVCNKILVFFLGVTGVLAFFDPIRPFLGFLSIVFLGIAIFYKARSIWPSQRHKIE